MTLAISGVMPVLKVQDMQRAVNWYTQVIGFELTWRFLDEGAEHCMLRSGGIRMMLSTGDNLGGSPAFTGTLYFNTPHVEPLFERLKDIVDVIWPLQQMDYGTLEFGIHDLDGYRLAFTKRVEA
jgi:uncharacterized glyoxalase superfamily protein PhnB